MMRTICRHCKKEPASRPRGLGWRCFYTPSVRALYPSGNPYRVNPDTYGGHDLPDPTDTEPGTPERIAVLAERAANGQRLWHPADPVVPLAKRNVIPRALFRVLVPAGWLSGK